MSVVLRLAFNRVVCADGLYGVAVEVSMCAYDAVEVDRLRRLLLEPGADQVDRRTLWRSWGPCPRHAWAAAVVECELDWQPYVTARLCQELLSRAVQVMAAPAWPRRLRQRALRGRGACPVCIGQAPDPGGPNGETAHALQVNTGARFRALAEQSRALWLTSTCPVCAGGHGPVCRLHLLELPGGFTRQATARLKEIHRRLAELMAALARDGRGRTSATDAGLVEALGFLAGWSDAPVDVFPP